MRRAAFIAGLLGLALGVALALWPFHQSFDMHPQGPGERPQLIGVSDCGVPIAASFSDEPDVGWFSYAPESGVNFPGRFECRSEARWRAAAGTVIAMTGLGLVVFGPKRAGGRAPLRRLPSR